MYFDNEKNGIVARLECGDATPTCEEVIESMAYSIDVTFGDVLNEGAPVSLGNSYARYEFTAYVDGDEHEFAFGPYELRRLIRTGKVFLSPLDASSATDVEREEIAYDVLERNVWDKFPTGDERELFLWADEHASKAIREYALADGEDESERLYAEAVKYSEHLIELFKTYGIETMGAGTYMSLMTDLARAEVA